MSTRLRSSRAAAISAAIGLLLVVAAFALPRMLNEDVRVHWPPLHADWQPMFGWLSVPALAFGALLVWGLPQIGARLSWRQLLLAAYASTWSWTMVVAHTEGTSGISRVFERKGEYVYDAQRIGDIGLMLRTFIDRIPMDSVDHWYTHVAGHPPGALLFFVVLDRIGITSPYWIGVTVVTIGSLAVVAALVTFRVLGSTSLARSAMPWLVLAPTVVYMGVNGDAVYTAVSAWGLALLALAAKATGRSMAAYAIGAGLLLGLCVYFSYGLVLLGILALAVLLIAQSWRALPWALGGALAVTAAFAAAGFYWWEAYPVLVERYYDGIASDRPYVYWVWANIAAWTFTVGLAVWAAFPRAMAAIREGHVVARLAGAAMLTIVVATLSGMSKAEVERIWMPFTLWVVALPLLLPRRWHRPLLASQVVLALCVQHLLLTRW